MLKDTLSKYTGQFVEVQKIQAVNQKCCHLGVFFVRHIAHSVDKTECEKLKKVELERGRSTTLTVVKDGKVLVVVVLQQIRDYAKEVKEVDLEETLVDIRAQSLSFGL